MLGKIIYDFGQPWCKRHQEELGAEEADKVVDFYNNGGLEFTQKGVSYAVQYASVRWPENDKIEVEVGAWAWNNGESFDPDAVFIVYDESDFTKKSLDKIVNKIKEIYGQGKN